MRLDLILYRREMAFAAVAGFVAGAAFTAIYCAQVSEPPLVRALNQSVDLLVAPSDLLQRDECITWDYRHCRRLLHFLDEAPLELPAHGPPAT